MTTTKFDAKLLAEILEHPMDDAPRLVLADALQSKNDPRGEFIVTQCHLADRSTPRDERGKLKLEEARLLKEHEKSWLAVVEGLSGTVMRRGFIDQISANATKLAKVSSDLFSSEPVTKLTVTDASSGKLSALAKDGVFSRVLKLTIRGQMGNAGAEALAKALAARKFPLLSLNIGGTGIESSGMASLAEVLTGCQKLCVTGNSVGDEGLAAIAKSKALGSLETLFIAASEVSDEGVTELSKSATLTSLTKLAIARNEDLTEEGLRALAHSKKFKLRWLEYSDEDSGGQTIATR